MKRILIAIPFAIFLHQPQAEACGGFFCSQQPVVQTAERIVFEVQADVVTAYVQLRFSGADPEFAWIVPVPSVPEVSVGVGQQMFDELDARTQPIFTGFESSQAVLVGDSGAVSCGGGGDTPRDPAKLKARVVPPPDVDVWKQGKIGPYEYVVVQAEKASDLDAWLEVNGYRTEPEATPIVQQYLDEGMKLLAVKLRSDGSTNLLEPIKMVYHDEEGCSRIPLRLTAIASAPDLEIVTWIFGHGRAVADNTTEVVLDPAEIMTPAEYVPAMGRAIDIQSEGRGFVTELAAPTARINATDPTLKALLDRHSYVTRVRTFISAEEMTLDPGFRLDPNGEDVSNVIALGKPRGASIGAGTLLAVVAFVLVARRWRRA